MLAPARPAILVVEDPSLFMQVLRDALRDVAGEFRLICVGTGHAAVAALMQDPTIMVMIVDITLDGELSGLDVLYQLRQFHVRPVAAGMPVAVLSGSDARIDMDAAAKMGGRFIPKPSRPDKIPDMHDAIEAWCSTLLETPLARVRHRETA